MTKDIHVTRASISIEEIQKLIVDRMSLYKVKNNNNVFDKDEKVVGDYLVTFNSSTFKADKNGTFTYRALSFGKYSLKLSA